MKTTAAILVETGKPLVLGEMVIPPLKPGQVLVEVTYSGICHTQVMEVRGHRGADPYLPHCLGHEGSGHVLEVGDGVTKVKVDDHVILSWIKGSGLDVPGTVYQWDGRKVNAGGITTFQRHAIISENRLTVLPNDFPLMQAALLGCAVPTGMGAVMNTARPKPGQSIVIFGAGGVGQCALAAASLAGCTPIIAVDILAEKLALARQMGATHTINPFDGDPVTTIKNLCPGGADYAIEATGNPSIMTAALEAVHPQGGVAVIIGNAPYGERVEIDPRQLNMGKQLRGTWGGDNQPDTDYPRYAKFVQAGMLNLGPLMMKVYSLDQINTALDDLEGGKSARPLIEMSRV